MIERQLAHAESNKVREAYTHAAQYLDERKRMMQAWADYLDGLRAGGQVIAKGLLKGWRTGEWIKTLTSVRTAAQRHSLWPIEIAMGRTYLLG